jgi:hypothetical protein
LNITIAPGFWRRFAERLSEIDRDEGTALVY